MSDSHAGDWHDDSDMQPHDACPPDCRYAPTHVNVVEEVQPPRHVLRDILPLVVPRQLPAHFWGVLPHISVQSLYACGSFCNIGVLFKYMHTSVTEFALGAAYPACSIVKIGAAGCPKAK